MKFKQGDYVRKIKGYEFYGYVVGSFTNIIRNTVFVNVQHEHGWIMHFDENDLAISADKYVTVTQAQVDYWRKVSSAARDFVASQEADLAVQYAEPAGKYEIMKELILPEAGEGA